MDEGGETEPCVGEPVGDNNDKPAEPKLCLQLNIMVEEEKREDNHRVNDHVCEFCNKSFSSGKGLGGHMRVHAQVSSKTRNQIIVRRNIHSKPSFKRSSNSDGDGDGDDGDRKLHGDGSESATCVVCGKTFPSMKSLYGHMRSHPEREWRGVHPPTTRFSGNSSGHSTSSAADTDSMRSAAAVAAAAAADEVMSQSLTGWAIASNRSGKRSMSSDSVSGSVGSDSGPELTDLEASNNLLLLSKANPLESAEAAPPASAAHHLGTTDSSVLNIVSERDNTDLSKKQKLEPSSSASPADTEVMKEESFEDAAVIIHDKVIKSNGEVVADEESALARAAQERADKSTVTAATIQEADGNHGVSTSAASRKMLIFDLNEPAPVEDLRGPC